MNFDESKSDLCVCGEGGGLRGGGRVLKPKQYARLSNEVNTTKQLSS